MKGLLTSRIRKNIAALMTLQIGNYIFPLLLVPYLVRVLGLEVFGTWMFALAFVIVARTCVTYGFDLTATRQVALNRDRPDVLSELYQAVVIVRLVIWLACFAVLLTGMFVVDDLQQVSLLISLAMLILIGEILFPVWLFQGAETMALITKVKLATKAVNLLLVLLLVKNPEDVFLVPLLEAATSLAAGLIALLVAIRRFDLRWVPPHISRISSEFRDGAVVFLAQASVHAYTTINVIILGFLMGPVAVAQYSIAEKIYSAVRGILSPIVQAFFPSMSIKFENSSAEFRPSLIRLALMIGSLLTIAALLVVVTADWLVLIVAGQHDEAIIIILRILGFALFFALGAFFGPMLVAQRRNRLLLQITVIGGVIGIGTIVPLVTLFGVMGAATSFLVVQIYNTVALFKAAMRGNRGNMS
ncbi:MAG: hypothetical protein EBU46_01055 [Nitrosomonadaceae bacterium]|nr:hypothetical protein [Nitrosomonadaceae bacterium]